MKILKQSNHGFSLIEVAIAVVIIGLITGLALKGSELIRTAKLKAVTIQANTIKVVSQIFADKYGGLPGSISNATKILGDTTDGRADDTFTSVDDAKRFFSHLNAAGLISLEMRNGLPISKLGGIFTVSSKIDGHPGVWLVLCGSTNDNKKFTAILTPEEGYSIDKNDDTGDPITGDIQAIKGDGSSSDCISGHEYNFKSKDRNCVLLFRIL